MKKVNKFLLLFLLFFFSLCRVDAAVEYSGGGYKFTGGGSERAGECSGGYCVFVAPMLKFTLVQISGSSLVKHKEFLMLNKNRSEWIDRFYNKNGISSKAVIGTIVENKYQAFAQNMSSLILSDHYVFNNINSILPNESYLNFEESQVEAAIINTSSESGITDQYEKLVLFMLNEAGLTPTPLTKIEDFSDVSNYRMLIEPVYALKENGKEKYIYATSKAIGVMVPEAHRRREKYLGVYGSQLYANSVAEGEREWGPINNPNFIAASGDYFDKLADINHGAGYAMVKLYYGDTPVSNVCTIEQDDSGNVLYNAIDGLQYSDGPNNFEYFIESCCTPFENAITSNPLYEELMENEVYKAHYRNYCVSSSHTKTCQHEVEDGNNVFFNNSGDIISDFSDFIDSCGCYNSSVYSLKGNSGFSDIYNSKCVTNIERNTYDSDLNRCDESQTVQNYTLVSNKEKTINNYCTLNCEENINFKDVMGKYSVKAGKYFELNMYPKLIATKSCKVNVDYSTWKNDYDSVMQQQVNTVNAWNKYIAAQSPESYQVTCSCGYQCTYVATRYYVDSGKYQVYSYNNGNISSSGSPYFSWGGCSGSSAGTDPTASARFSTIKDELEEHFENLKTCSSYLYNMGDMDQYYNFEVGLDYYYYQDYKLYGIKRNDEKVDGNVDDSKMLEIPGDMEETGNYVRYFENDNDYVYMTGRNNFSSYYAGVSSGEYASNIIREVERNYSFSPSVNKYIESYTALIHSDNRRLQNASLLGPVYDIDVSAVPKVDNDNYFSFSSLGDNNKIFEHYNSSNPDKLKRYCSYEITSDILTGCDTEPCDVDLKLIYRIVDPNNIDPNNRKGTDNGFKNWDNKKGEAVIKEMQESDTYSLEKLEYSFTLNSATIKEIRKYNNGCDEDMKNCTNPIIYSNVKEAYSELECNRDGNECISEFISELANDEDGHFGNSVASNIRGRDRWKYLDYNVDRGYYIHVFEKDEANYADLISKLEGVGVTP